MLGPSLRKKKNGVLFGRFFSLFAIWASLLLLLLFLLLFFFLFCFCFVFSSKTYFRVWVQISMCLGPNCLQMLSAYE